MGSFVNHAAFAHDTAGVGVVGIVTGLDPVHAHIPEEKADDSLQSLRGDALMPPPLSDAVTDLDKLSRVIVGYHRDRAYGLACFFQHDGPLVESIFLIVGDPILQDHPGDIHAAMGRPGQISGDLQVRCPVAVHGRRVFQRKGPQDQPGGFQFFRSKVFHNPFSLSKRDDFCEKVIKGMYHLSAFEQTLDLLRCHPTHFGYLIGSGGC